MKIQFFAFCILINGSLADVLHDIIRSSFPPLKRCTHVLAFNNYNMHVLEIFHKDSYSILITLNLTLTIGDKFMSNNCEDFVIECENEQDLFDVVEYLKIFAKSDFKFASRILIVVHDLEKMEDNSEVTIELAKLRLNILVIRQYLFDFSDKKLQVEEDGEELTMLNAPLLRKTIVYDVKEYTRNPRRLRRLFNEQKEFLDLGMINNSTFRVSLFECPPFVIYVDEQLDGIEYRIIKEISKSWKLHVNRRDYSENISNPWSTVIEDVVQDYSDLAMCSIWQKNTNYSVIDFSHEYSSLCATFLVPKPTLINPATYLFLPLNRLVWIGLIVAIFVAMGWLYLAGSSNKM